MMLHTPQSKYRKTGITLPELLVALSVFAIVIALVLNFYKEVLVDTHFEAKKNELNSSLRTITSELLLHARQSDYILLYKSFNPRDRKSADDRLFEGKAGDLLVMVSQGKGKENQLSNKRPIVKIVGYYRDPESTKNPQTKGPLKRFVIEIPKGSTKIPEDLIPQRESKQFKEMAPSVLGLTNERSFYNLNNKNIITNISLSTGSGDYQYSHRLNLTLSPKE